MITAKNNGDGLVFAQVEKSSGKKWDTYLSSGDATSMITTTKATEMSNEIATKLGKNGLVLVCAAAGTGVCGCCIRLCPFTLPAIRFISSSGMGLGGAAGPLEANGQLTELGAKLAVGGCELGNSANCLVAAWMSFLSCLAAWM